MHDLAFAAPFAPLAAFGERLALWHDGNAASWSLDGRTATVVARPDGSVQATFADRATSDGGATAAVAVYRSHSVYTLGAIGCTRMVDDMIAFFDGVREPRFAFTRIDDAPALRR